jgi:hypothetical protein
VISLAFSGAPFVPAVLFCIIFGWAGLIVGIWAVLAVRNRQSVIHADFPSAARWFLNIWTGFNIGACLSMLFGAVLIWSNWPIALALALWPVILVLLLAGSRCFTVISKISTGSDEVVDARDGQSLEEGRTPEMANELLQLEQDWIQALKALDREALKRLLAPEFRLSFSVDPRAPRVISREEWFENLDKMSFSGADILDFEEVFLGNVGVFQMRARFNDWRFEGNLLPALYTVTDVFVHRKGRWQVINRISESLEGVPNF